MKMHAVPAMSPKEQAVLDQSLDLHAVGNEQELGEGAGLSDLDHPREARRCGVGEDVEKVRNFAAGPDGDGPAEVLKPDLRPVLPERPREQFQMPEHFQPLAEIQLQVLLYCRAQKASSPASAAAMSHRAPYRASRGEEEKIDVWVHLANYAEVDIEVEVQSPQRDVGSQAAILPLVSERVRG